MPIWPGARVDFLTHFLGSGQFQAAASPAGRVFRAIQSGRSGQRRARPGRPGAGRSGRAGGGLRPVYCAMGCWRPFGRPGRRSASAADLRALAGALAGFSRPGEGRARPEDLAGCCGLRRGRPDLAEILGQLTAQATQAAISSAGAAGSGRRRWPDLAAAIRSAGALAGCAALAGCCGLDLARPRSGGRRIWPEALRPIWRAWPIWPDYRAGRKRKAPARRPGLVGWSTCCASTGRRGSAARGTGRRPARRI